MYIFPRGIFCLCSVLVLGQLVIVNNSIHYINRYHYPHCSHINGMTGAPSQLQATVPLKIQQVTFFKLTFTVNPDLMLITN